MSSAALTAARCLSSHSADCILIPRCRALVTRHRVDPGELGPKGHMPGREFIPAGPAWSFDSHICFAAHMPLKMPDGSSRIYYMGGNGMRSCLNGLFVAVCGMILWHVSSNHVGAVQGLIQGNATRASLWRLCRLTVLQAWPAPASSRPRVSL